MSRYDRHLNGEELSVGETFVGGVREHFWMTGSTISVQSRHRDSCVQNLYFAAFSTLIAISIMATHT
jgi:hypothetical protein